MTRWLRAVVGCLLVGGWPLVLPAQPPEVVNMGFYPGVNRDMSVTGLRVAFNLWSQELASTFQTQVNVQFFEDMAAMRQAFDRGEINAVSASGLSLARYFDPAELASGYAVAMPGGGNLVLLAGKSSTAKTLADLKGLRIAVAHDEGMLDTYLETLCMQAHRLRCAQVFAEMQDMPSSNQALMRLYFGKADLALVYRYGYELARELNPQIEARVGRVVNELPLEGGTFFSFFSKTVNPAYRDRMLALVPKLHTYPRGRQLLDMLKMDHLEVVKPEALRTFVQVDQRYRALNAELPPKGKAP